jgi:hypothetical protein
MTAIRPLLAAAILACGTMAQAQTGVVAPASAPAAASARAAASGPSARVHRRASLANTASRQLNAADVNSRANPRPDLKTQADADLARRDARPRLKAERQNLKGDAAARAIAQQHNQATYDRDISRGDKDHTEQSTSLKVYLKK